MEQKTFAPSNMDFTLAKLVQNVVYLDTIYLVKLTVLLVSLQPHTDKNFVLKNLLISAFPKILVATGFDDIGKSEIADLSGAYDRYFTSQRN